MATGTRESEDISRLVDGLYTGGKLACLLGSGCLVGLGSSGHFDLIFCLRLQVFC